MKLNDKILKSLTQVKFGKIDNSGFPTYRYFEKLEKRLETTINEIEDKIDLIKSKSHEPSTVEREELSLKELKLEFFKLVVTFLEGCAETGFFINAGSDETDAEFVPSGKGRYNYEYSELKNKKSFIKISPLDEDKPGSTKVTITYVDEFYEAGGSCKLKTDTFKLGDITEITFIETKNSSGHYNSWISKAGDFFMNPKYHDSKVPMIVL
jgi:hypothetical protein